ncbi:hypothetical protein Taro_048775 [Colocasia esculenta]|uniref:Uncharacterized protein n=1 Tax=Colocasia esculenta TaxID=4460 RepID=A0A843X933_COLES|nr:hypothetical protein [Colocasia esculenta]
MAGGPEQEATGAGSVVGNSTENDARTNNRAGGSPPSPPLPLSCTKCFDALWFCYSPVHQMQQYYRRGEFDSCFEKWNTLFDCLKLKTKKPSEVQVSFKF